MTVFNLSKKGIQITLIVLVILLAALPSVYFYTKYRQAQTKLQNTNTATQEETKNLIAKVAKLMILPTDEEPTIASITDKDKLKSQPFFINAANGDKMLLYMKAKKAILYRPSSNQIVEVAPMSINENASASATTTQTTATASSGFRFVLYNGTTTVGLTKRFTPTLEAKVAGAKVVDTDNAAKKDYTTSILVDLLGTRTTEATTYAKALGISVSPLPVGEKATASADFLIILGADKK